MAGTHWVWPGRLLCGRSAGGMSAAELEALVVVGGVDAFVCLQASYREYGCEDYRATLRALAGGPGGGGGGQGAAFPPRALSFLHCPVPDFGVVSDRSLVALVDELRRAIDAGRCLYVHCMGGHGRTGTVVANLIAAVDGRGFPAALAALRAAHRGRGCRGHCALGEGRLEDESQMAQGRKVSGAMSRNHKLHK